MITMPKNKDFEGGEKRLSQRQRLFIAGAAGILALFLLLFFLPKGKNASTKEVALHYADSWRDIGAIDGCFFFRDGKNLIAFDAGGKRWEVPIAADAKPIYGDRVYLLQKDHAIQVLNPKNGQEVQTIQEDGLLGLMAVEKRAFSPAALIGIKADRFVVFDKEGTIQSVQKTAGAPGLLAQTDTHVAWTEEGSSKGIHTTGTVEKAPGFSLPQSTADEPVRSVLVLRTVTPEKPKEKKEETPDALLGEDRFQLHADAPFTRLYWTGEKSFVVSQEKRLYFVMDNIVTTSIPLAEGWDMAVNEEGVWVTDGRALTCYAVDGKAVKTTALDFPPLRVIAGKNGMVVIGKNRRMTLKGENKEVLDTQEFIRALPQADGATMLVYRESFFVLP